MILMIMIFPLNLNVKVPFIKNQIMKINQQFINNLQSSDNLHIHELQRYCDSVILAINYILNIKDHSHQQWICTTFVFNILLKK